MQALKLIKILILNVEETAEIIWSVGYLEIRRNPGFAPGHKVQGVDM